MSDTTKRVLLGGLFHETHTFLPELTSLEDCLVMLGAEILTATGDASPLGGVLERAQELGWHVVPAVDVRAMPGPTMKDDVVAFWWMHFEVALREALVQGIDGIYLVLHGAMASQTIRDVEGEILERIRAVVGSELPIAGVTDLHANFSRRMALHSNALVTYRENPHIDARETAVRAAGVLDRLMRGERAVTVYEQPALVWPPTGTDTADEPMRGLERMAREIEANHPEILAVNIHAGYSYVDTLETGVSFSAVTTGAPEAASRELERLSSWAVANKAAGNVIEAPLQSVVPHLLEMLKTEGNGPIVLAEPSDNIGGGAPGDSNHILRMLLEQDIDNAAVVINDPHAVEQLKAAQPGARLTLPIGGHSGPLSGGPLVTEVELLSLSDGHFQLEDPNSHLASSHGLHIDMGPCAVVRCAGVRVLLTSLKTPPFDLGQLRSQGIIPETLALVGVKSAVAYRRAYDPIARVHLPVATPGPCSSDLTLLPFEHLRRPVYPLDTI